jgi:curved DNA-binding protein CbpA
MKSVEQCLEILSVPRNATPDEIKVAYRDLVRVWHPDRFAHDKRLQQKAEEKLKDIIEAYEQLQSTFAHAQSGATRTSNTSEPKPIRRTAVSRNKPSATQPGPASKQAKRNILSGLRLPAMILLAVPLAALTLWFAKPTSMPDQGKQLDPLQLKARKDIFNTITEERAGVERLLTLHQSEVNRLTEFYEEQRKRNLEGRVATKELLQAEQAVSEARRRVDEDKRRLAESDMALKTFVAEEEKLRSR